MEYEFHTVTDTRTGRDYQFKGKKLAHTDTHRPGRARWSELDLYRTEGGSYVLVKTGRSIQYHSVENRDQHGEKIRCRFAGKKSFKAQNSGAGIPCLHCGPGPYDEMVLREKDLVTVAVSKSAAGAIESAHIVDADRVVFLPPFANDLLIAASEVDEDIKESFKTEVVL